MILHRAVVVAVAALTAISCSGTSDMPAPSTSAQVGSSAPTATRPSLPPGNGSLRAANPVVEGPVGAAGARGRPWNASLVDLEPLGYVEEEYFISGTAQRLDGGEAPYRTRMLVRRPADPERFNGTAVVEWLNVTLGVDIETVWPMTWQKMIDDGYLYVAVSVQQVGVCCGPLSLQEWDPIRYGSLVHPGGDYPIMGPADDYNPDIFRQAIRALRFPGDNPAGDAGPSADPTGGLDVRAVVATGNSQSAGRLMTYINLGYDAADPVIDVFALGRAQYRVTRDVGGTEHAPVFLTIEEGLPEQPPDDDRLVIWEEAGTAHGPQVLWDYLAPLLERDAGAAPSPAPGCSHNRGSADFTARAMLDRTQDYLRTGGLPPSAPRIAREGDGAVRRDDDGLAEGGLRHPFIDVPVSFNSAERVPGCNNILQGIHRPWPASKIRERYGSHDTYADRVRASADRLHRDGFLTDADRSEVIRLARSFVGPWLEGCRRDPSCVVDPPLGL
jgi:hypothetical protein